MRIFLILGLTSFLVSCQVAEVKNSPAYPGPILFVSNLGGNDKNGYAKVMKKPEGTFRCGRDPYAVEVGWKFLGRSPIGDVYGLTESSTVGTEAKKIVYSGKPLDVWKDGHRAVVIKPKEP
ncbi:hypothetical protein BH09VER1_BH09VER1_34500 [soil metagenome]